MLVAILRGREDAERKMEDLDNQGRQSTTAICAFELFYGAHKSAQRQANVGKTKSLLERLDILSFDQDSAEAAGELLADLARLGHPADYRDAMIAGISPNGITLVTRNAGHFNRVKDLKLETW